MLTDLKKAPPDVEKNLRCVSLPVYTDRCMSIAPNESNQRDIVIYSFKLAVVSELGADRDC